MIAAIMAGAQILNDVGKAFSEEAYRKIENNLRSKQEAMQRQIAKSNADTSNAMREARNITAAASGYQQGVAESLALQNKARALGSAHDAAAREASRLSESATSQGLASSLDAAAAAGALKARMAMAGAGGATAALHQALAHRALYRESVAQEMAGQRQYEATLKVKGLESQALNPDVLSLNIALDGNHDVAAYVNPAQEVKSTLWQSIGSSLARNVPGLLQDIGRSSTPQADVNPDDYGANTSTNYPGFSLSGANTGGVSVGSAMKQGNFSIIPSI